MVPINIWDAARLPYCTTSSSFLFFNLNIYLVVDLGFLKPVSASKFLTLTDFKIWILVAYSGYWTFFADFGFWTLVADVEFWTLVADVGFWTLVADVGF